MANLRVTRADGQVQEFEITPVLEVAFETYAKKGFHKALIEDQKQTDVYWLCWDAIRRSGETVKPFGEAFLETIKSVEVIETPPLG
jgi:hypothetical protein